MKLSPAQIPPACYILQLTGKETKQVIKGKKPTCTHKHMAWEPNYKAKCLKHHQGVSAYKTSLEVSYQSKSQIYIHHGNQEANDVTRYQRQRPLET